MDLNKIKKIMKIHCFYPKEFIVSPQEKRQWPLFKVLSERLSPEIGRIYIQIQITLLSHKQEKFIIRSPIPKLTGD